MVFGCIGESDNTAVIALSEILLDDEWNISLRIPQHPRSSVDTVQELQEEK